MSWARIALDTSAARELFEHDRGLDVAETGAAPPFADRDAEQLGLAHAVPRPLRELLGLVTVTGHGRELALGDVASELAQRGLILGIGKGIRTVRTRRHAAQGNRRHRFRAPRSMTTVSGMDLDSTGPSVDWLTAQPYEYWAKARAECPVIDVEDMMMGAAAFYQVTRYKDAERVLRDDTTFSSSINAEHIGQFMGDLILAMDGEEHRKYRNLVAKAFRASQLEQWDESLVRPTINRLLDVIAPLGRADLVAGDHIEISGAGDLRNRRRPARRRRAVRAVGRGDQHRSARARARTCREHGDGRLLADPSSRRGARNPPATSSPTSCTRRSTASS